MVVVSWNQLPDLTYWIFYRAGSSVVPAVPGVPLIRGAQSPRVVVNVINGIQYAFVMNATHQDSPAGPASPVVLATPRRAGATETWASGTPLGGVPLQNLNAVAFGAARLVAVGDAGTLFSGVYNYTNANPPGVTAWVLPSLVPAGFAKDLRAVIFTGALFAALAADGSIVTSADGLTWTSVTATNPITANGMNSLALGSVSFTPVFVAVGAAGSIFTSRDLANWTSVVPVTPDELYAVSFLNGGFVAVGAKGALLTSPDGSNWTAQDSKTQNTLRGVAHAVTLTGARYVAVGDAGTVATSSDAIVWSAAVPPLAQNLRRVTFGSRFIAVGQGGAVAYSDDGLNWTPASAGSADLNAVIFTPGMYVAVGASGANTVSR